MNEETIEQPASWKPRGLEWLWWIVLIAAVATGLLMTWFAPN